MSVILQDPRFKAHLLGVINRQGLNRVMPLQFEDTIRPSLLRFTDDIAIRLLEDVQEWIDDNCETQPVLRFANNKFVISFTNEEDATLFQIVYR